MCGKFTKLQVIWIIIFYRSVIHFCLVTLVIMEGCVCQLRMFTSKKRMLLFDLTLKFFAENSHFFSKKYQNIVIESAETVNEMTLNELVKLTTL